MKLRTSNDFFAWTAIDEDTYDGPGSPIGIGPTEAAAIADLEEQLEPDPAEACTDPEDLRPGFIHADEEEDHRLDDPRHGQARDINRRYR